MPHDPATFDRSAAVTRSLLGWGVVAGPWYVVTSLVLGLTRPGFDPARHALSLLMLGEHGWLERAVFVVSALMTLAAAYGVLRAVRDGRGLAIGVLTGAYGGCLVLSAAFGPDPVDGFPPGTGSGTASAGGILHLLFGAVGFVCLAAAAAAFSRWAARRGETGAARLGLVCALVVLVGFAGGAVLARSPAGVALLWLAVLGGWLWLALASAHLYRVVPHPVVSERTRPQEA
ncbi:DUF998 domain-containing protein [Amycolatopsis jiangsuensis]|uniref:DUF998 domain-containing protein n=1 Tax=Amycolatopsis jiangsuensis TaxID=1181879 RepID=A0A840ITN0_9PSEU|nr:DUF998 domain-containing protein [Amycolatopsis jiangsuensis]MBB4684815.1 hypothetical protein [Amycolatopsis jiangsuensis]